MAKYNQKIIKRDKKITIRLTRMEREILTRKAKFCATSLSSYLRTVALEEPLPQPIQLSEEQHQNLLELKNLLQNKMKKSANYFQQKNPRFALEIKEAVEQLQDFLSHQNL